MTNNELKNQLSIKIPFLNHIVNEVNEINKFLKEGFKYFKSKQYFIADDFDANNEYINVLRDHLTINSQFALINLSKILKKKEQSSLECIYNTFSCNAKKQIFINNVYYDSFVKEFPIFKNKYENLISEIINCREFYAHSDFSKYSSKEYYLKFYFNNCSLIDEMINDINSLLIQIIQCYYPEFKDENLVSIDGYIIIGKDKNKRPVISNYNSDLYKILDLFKDISEIQNIVRDSNLNNDEKMDLINEVLTLKKLPASSIISRFYKYSN